MATYSTCKDCFQLPKLKSVKLIKFFPGGEQDKEQVKRPIISALKLYLGKLVLYAGAFKVALNFWSPLNLPLKGNRKADSK